jgi:hypothetical protein
MPAKPKVLVATEGFCADIDGTEILVHVGDRYAATHPIVKAHGRWFEPVKRTDEP